MRYQFSRGRLTPTEPRPQRNNPRWWLLLHFPSLRLRLSKYASVTLLCSVPLPSFVSCSLHLNRHSLDRGAHPHTHHQLLLRVSPVVQASWPLTITITSVTRGHRPLWLCPLPAAAHPVELSEHDPGLDDLVMFLCGICRGCIKCTHKTKHV